MKKIGKISILYILIYLSPPNWNGSLGLVLAQNVKIDSLQNVLKATGEDTIKVNTLNVLSWILLNESEFIEAMKYARQSIALANSIPQWNFERRSKARATAYTNIGIIYDRQGNFSEGLKNHFNSLQIKKTIGDKKGIANSYGNIGVIYYDQGNYPEALKNQLIALKIREELGDKTTIAATYNNIGLIYWRQGSYSEALKNHKMSLKMKQEKEDKKGIAASYNNIGNVYEDLGDNFGALNNYLAAAKTFELIRSKKGIAVTYNNIGNIYFKLRNYSQALKNFQASLKIKIETGDKDGMANSYVSLGSLYIKLNKLEEAKKMLNEALSLSKEIGSKDIIKASYNSLSELDSTQGDWKNAYEHHKLFMVYRDSLLNEENTKKTVQAQMQYDFDKQVSNTQAEQEKKDSLIIVESRKQKLILLFVLSGLLFVIIFSGFIFRSLRITRKQKQIIEIKSSETNLQKKIIEEKNKDITDSIHYAKRIQDALLREEEHVSKHLPEHFILFLPKDIVSGDFYWGAEKQGYWYFAAVDCTGHGVPGAVMSMLGISFLNDIVSSEALLSPAEVLDQLKNKVVKELRQTGEAGGSKDGMDISIGRLNLKTNDLQWAGANNPLNFIRNGQLEVLKADKQPIGYHPKNHPFTNHEIQLKKGDSIFIYSDGYADQFGGPNGKKFKYKQLEDLLIANNHLPLTDQKEILKKCFTEWKGNLEQVDDVCVFGVRI
ncbi:MAG: tetratricopeptide repeat protein [Bacteroidota bacterium]